MGRQQAFSSAHLFTHSPAGEEEGNNRAAVWNLPFPGWGRGKANINPKEFSIVPIKCLRKFLIKNSRNYEGFMRAVWISDIKIPLKFVLQLRASSQLQVQMSQIYSKTTEENCIAPQKIYWFIGLYRQYNLEKFYTKLIVLLFVMETLLTLILLAK